MFLDGSPWFEVTLSGAVAMMKLLRRLGIPAFMALSILFWGEVADSFADSVLTLGNGFTILLLGSSLACFTVLILSEISTWGQRLLESTRRVTLLAELIPTDPENDHETDERLFSEGAIALDGSSLYGEDSAKRKWVDVRQSVELEGSRG